jgi:hypothetical protein
LKCKNNFNLHEELVLYSLLNKKSRFNNLTQQDNMKTIKLLLIISQMLVSVQFIHAQVMMSNVSYMYLSRDAQNVRKFLFIDIDLSNAKDTNIEYVVIPGESILVNGNKVYHKIKKIQNKVDTILYFDFDLKVNDKINRGYLNYLYVVDSIKSIQLADSNFYLHWFLSSKQAGAGNLVWIKGLGDSRRGWIRDDASFAPSSPKLKAICRNNDLVFWNNSFNDFEPDTVQPTCDFDSLFIKYTSVPQINSNSLKIYPNPTTEKLFIENNLVQSGNYIITNLLGQEMDKGLLKSEINISNLLNGVYFIAIVNANNQTQALKFVKQ